jgi:hypothetical protein
VTVDRRTLRKYAPLLVLIVTVGLGWTIFVRPLSADRTGSGAQIERLRQRELMLRRDLGVPSPPVTSADPAARFERQLSAADASPALLEQLARLAATARARNLLIETMEPAAGGAAVPTQGGPAEAGRYAAQQRDPRFALFDVPVSQLPIRVAFDTDYAGVGRFFWAFRDLPTTVEIRALSIGLPPASDEDAPESRPDDLRVSLTLHAYSRAAPAALQASNTVPR